MGAQTHKFDYFRSSSAYLSIKTILSRNGTLCHNENGSFVVWREATSYLKTVQVYLLGPPVSHFHKFRNTSKYFEYKTSVTTYCYVKVK
jgi:hypothetical protein